MMKVTGWCIGKYWKCTSNSWLWDIRCVSCVRCEDFCINSWFCPTAVGRNLASTQEIRTPARGWNASSPQDDTSSTRMLEGWSEIINEWFGNDRIIGYWESDTITLSDAGAIYWELDFSMLLMESTVFRSLVESRMNMEMSVHLIDFEFMWGCDIIWRLVHVLSRWMKVMSSNAVFIG